MRACVLFCREVRSKEQGGRLTRECRRVKVGHFSRVKATPQEKKEKQDSVAYLSSFLFFFLPSALRLESQHAQTAAFVAVGLLSEVVGGAPLLA